MTNLPAGKDNVKVTIMDPSLATAEWTNANTSLTFRAARSDKFGSTPVTLDYVDADPPSRAGCGW